MEMVAPRCEGRRRTTTEYSTENVGQGAHSFHNSKQFRTIISSSHKLFVPEIRTSYYAQCAPQTGGQTLLPHSKVRGAVSAFSENGGFSLQEILAQQILHDVAQDIPGRRGGSLYYPCRQ